MSVPELHLSERHQAIADRFVAACRADARVVAAFLGGSYARGVADAQSDLDLYLITTDEAYADFFAERAAFIRQLGEPVFLEDFDAYGFDLSLFVFSDGTEGELAFGREGDFRQIHGGAYVVLLDRNGLLADAVFPEHRPSPTEQVERLHNLLYWFWHDLSHHLITPLARDRPWTAIGALEDLRRTCVDLARLAVDFTMAAEGYEQVERALPKEQLVALKGTFCPPERGAILCAARALVAFYREVGPALAQAHGITYPTALERIVSARLDALDNEAGTLPAADESGT